MLLLLLIAGSTGCARTGDSSRTTEESAGENSFWIYYMSTDAMSLVRHVFKPGSENFEGILAEVLEAYKTPDTKEVLSALPKDVEINSTVTVINELDVDFSSGYLALDPVRELLLRASLVKTLLQLQGVNTVRFTVDSQSLVVGNAEVGPMTEDTFIVPLYDAINSYRYEALTLYFPKNTMDSLVREDRTAYYSTNVNIERIVIEEMLKGPQTDGLISVTGGGVLLRDVIVADGICTVDFSSEINNYSVDEDTIDSELILYAFTNSLIDSCESEGIEGVRFMIDGTSETRFRDGVNLDRVFTRNADLIAERSGDQSQETSSPETAAPEESVQAENVVLAGSILPQEEASAPAAKAQGNTAASEAVPSQEEAQVPNEAAAPAAEAQGDMNVQEAVPPQEEGQVPLETAAQEAVPSQE